MPATKVLSQSKQLDDEQITIVGAHEHNLKNVSLSIPRNRLVVITGVSGSGKSSLAFDTLYAEGQRRYLETFSAYARQFLGGLERPKVEQITGLSPVISIEQKTISKNPRSTVGTITEVHDFLRLVFARAADAFSMQTGEAMVRFTDEEILERILESFHGERIHLLAPLVRGRKGHYRELFESISKQGYLRARVDGALIEIEPGMKLDRYKVHDIEVVIDRLEVRLDDEERLLRSIKTALNLGKGNMSVFQQDSKNLRHFSRNLMCPTTGEAYPNPEPNLFSFNSPYGACAQCNGLGEVAEAEIELIIPDDTKSIQKGGIEPLGEIKGSRTTEIIQAILTASGDALKTPIKDLSPEVLSEILYGSKEPIWIPGKANTRGHHANWEGVIATIESAAERSSSIPLRRWAKRFMKKKSCPSCDGTRLKPISLQFRLAGQNIAELGKWDLNTLAQWFDELDGELTDRQRTILKEPLKEIRARLGFLVEVGLDYLALDRSSRTLSGGEAQRIRLATQIGSRLTEVLYILDEPSIGLHQQDNERLINSLKALRDAGNSVIVIEHDEEMMMQADHLIDIGPGAGIHGGYIVAEGSPSEHLELKGTTAQYLNGSKSIPIPNRRKLGRSKKLKLVGATGHNLSDVDLTIPLGSFTCVSGISGSGKSSLVNQTLYPALHNHYYEETQSPLPFKSLKGLEHLDKIIAINQSPIGRTPRSNPATYTGIFNEIRSLFTKLPEAAIRGYKPGRFSFNVAGGRCEECKGAGVKTIEMNFLPDVHVTCETCNGKRYNRETLEVRYRGKSIADVLQMTVDESLEFFDSFPKLKRIIKTLKDVGLGYITLGQQSTTLSGGEAQRIKLAAELAKVNTGQTLYLLDEPTTGLHFQDIQMLINVLQRLVDHGNTVLVIEHNLDVLKVADYLIDLGPQGGMRGGEIVAEGTPEEVAKNPQSSTGPFLRGILGV
ncbi:MAG: excinuclease ABC subunit UvrA [Bacteroidetes bacterium]|nr:excinuclease ABC subunit UvrA [Bacteroidota bacterium]MDA1336758.1 excinuclease ABC subunit UvrA [Bacteroidota bacterium]